EPQVRAAHQGMATAATAAGQSDRSARGQEPRIDIQMRHILDTVHSISNRPIGTTKSAIAEAATRVMDVAGGADLAARPAGTVSGPPPLVAHLIHRLDVGGLENGLVNLINHMPAERYRHAI